VPPRPTPPDIRLLGPGDRAALRALLALFADAFEETDAISPAPADAWLDARLADDRGIALAAYRGAALVGGLTGHLLPQWQREGAELYLYDLAVAAPHRRTGVARELIAALFPIARARGAELIFVQADADDPAAQALYAGFGAGAGAVHYVLTPPPGARPRAG